MTKIIKTQMPTEERYFDDASLEDKECRAGNPLVFAYWYGVGFHEGTGHAIYQCADGKWDHANLGHCSCYGPWDNGAGPNGVYATWQELVATFSDELKKECRGIIEALANRPLG